MTPDESTVAVPAPPVLRGLELPGRRVLAWAAALLHRPACSDVLRFGDLRLDPGTREVRRGKRAIELTPIEFRLLELLLRSPNRVLTRSDIFTSVWGYDFGVMSN